MTLAYCIINARRQRIANSWRIHGLSYEHEQTGVNDTLSGSTWCWSLILHWLVSLFSVFNEPHLLNVLSLCVRVRGVREKREDHGTGSICFSLGSWDKDAAGWNLSKANILICNQRTRSAINSNMIWTQLWYITGQLDGPEAVETT